jgi:hypothetical protein
MGISAEYNPDLCLRSFEEFLQGKGVAEECLPRLLDSGKTFPSLKNGQRHYWLENEIPLRITTGNGQLSRPIASVQIIQVTHFMKDGRVHTRGEYKVVEVYDPTDKSVHFDGLKKIK